MILARQNSYLPPILFSLLLLIQANQLSGHKNRHNLDETREGDKSSRNLDAGFYDVVHAKANKEWTEKWGTQYYVEEGKDGKRKLGHRDKRIKNFASHKIDIKGKLGSKERGLSDTSNNRDRK